MPLNELVVLKNEDKTDTSFSIKCEYVEKLLSIYKYKV